MHCLGRRAKVETYCERKWTRRHELGIPITCNLKPATQCQQAYAKASRALGLIARTISYKSPEVLLKLYKTLVRPHVGYCVSAWSPYYVIDKALLERIQHWFTRMVPGLKSLPYEERLDRLGIWTLEERRNRADLLQVFKLYKGWSSTPFGHFFTASTVMNTRGHTAKINKPRWHLDLRRSFFSYRVIDRWIDLPQSIIDSGTVNTFKNRLNKLRKNRMGFFVDQLVRLAQWLHQLWRIPTSRCGRTWYVTWYDRRDT